MNFKLYANAIVEHISSELTEMCQELPYQVCACSVRASIIWMCILLDAINNGVVKSESKYQPHKSSRKTEIKTNVLLIALSLSRKKERIKSRSMW